MINSDADPDPGWVPIKPGSGSGKEKSRIRDKHPGSATLMIISLLPVAIVVEELRFGGNILPGHQNEARRRTNTHNLGQSIKFSLDRKEAGSGSECLWASRIRLH